MDDSELSDLELFSLIKCQNEKAFNFLFFRYEKLIKPVVYNLIRKFKLRNPSLDDYIEVGRIATNEAINTYEPSKGNFFNFWYNICYFRIIAECRKEYSKTRFNTTVMRDICDDDYEFEDNIMADQSLGIAEQISKEEIASKIKYLANTLLNERDQKILSLLADGYSFKEIAEGLNVTTKLIDNRIYIIRKKIKEHL